MSKKVLSWIFTAAVVLMSMTLTVGILFAGPSEAGANEVLSKAPQLKDKDGKLNDYVLSDTAKWVNDHFFGRQELISAHNKTVSTAFGVSAADDVIFGSNGWLYYASTLSDYTGVDALSRQEIRMAARNLALMQEYCQSQGREFAFMLAPNKNSLYPDDMPDYGVCNTSANAKLLMAELDALGVNYIDLFSAFGQQEEVLYFAHDSHWNSKGAALGADLINTAFGVESNYYGGDFSYKVVHDGDLYGMVYPGVQDTELDGLYGGDLAFSYKGPSTQADAIVLMTEGSGSGKLLCYRDSFGILLYPYLADTYGSAKFSRLVNYDLTENADYVAIELVERNLCYLIQNVPIMEAPVRTIDLPASVSGKAQAAVDGSSRSPEGYSLIRGTLPQTPDADSCVYVICDGVAYEAFCMENDGFAAHVPGKATHVVYSIGGTLQMFEIQ